MLRYTLLLQRPCALASKVPESRVRDCDILLEAWDDSDARIDGLVGLGDDASHKVDSRGQPIILF